MESSAVFKMRGRSECRSSMPTHDRALWKRQSKESGPSLVLSKSDRLPGMSFSDYSRMYTFRYIFVNTYGFAKPCARATAPRVSTLVLLQRCPPGPNFQENLVLGPSHMVDYVSAALSGWK